MRNDQEHELVAKRLFGLRQKVYVILLCIVLSSLLWLLIKLSQTYNEVKDFRINYTGVPQDKVLAGSSDSVLTLTIKTKGFKLLGNLFYSKVSTLSVPLSSYLHKGKPAGNEYFIVSSELKDDVGKQIHSEGSVVTLAPDTLFFDLESKVSKTLPVKIRFTPELDKQYNLQDTVRFYPSFVKVSGLREELDTMRYVYTTKKTTGKISSNTYYSLDYLPSYIEKGLTISPAYIKAFVAVEKYTEATVKVPVITESKDVKGLTIRTFPENVEITYHVSLKKYNDVKASMFKVYSEPLNEKLSDSRKLKVIIRESPTFVKIVKIVPEKVEYIIVK